MSFEELREYASGHLDRVLIAEVPALTPRQREVTVLWFVGLSRGGIAEELGIKLGTVRSHLRWVYDRLKVTSRCDFVRTIAGLLVVDMRDQRGPDDPTA